MAGRPIYRQSVKLIESQGGEEWVMEMVMSGATTAAIAALADVSRGMLYEWLHKDPKRWEAYQEARKLGAFAMADDALEIVDNATSESIAVDRERARIRQWSAERANREEFGKESGVQVNLSLGDLHLTALKEAKAERAALPPAEEDIPDAEFEVIDPDIEALL